MRLQASVLDLLVDGPSSVAGLYAAAVRNLVLSEPLRVRELVDAAEALRKKGLLRAWITVEEGDPLSPSNWDVEEAVRQYEEFVPKARLEDLAVDEIGLWYEITTLGRIAWNDGSQELGAANWKVEESRRDRLVRVYAEKVETAEALLRGWAEDNPDLFLNLELAVIRDSVDFTLGSGSRSVRGVEISCPVSYAK